MNVLIAHSLCPFPHLNEYGALESGLYYEHPKQCTKCKGTGCGKYLRETVPQGQVRHCVCASGLSVFVVSKPSFHMVINGVLDSGKNQACPAPVRKSLRQHKVSQLEVEKWLASLANVSVVLERDMETRVREVIGTLHDVKTAVNLVYRNAEALVQKYPGSTFDERVEGTEPELKSLLKSVGLLTTRFITSSIVANPESVRHGKKRSCPIYKVFHKMVRLFQEVAIRKHVHIQMSGASFRTPPVYDSFEALALVLIDNAVKYSEPGQQITVTVDDQNDGVYVAVESRGHTIAPDEEERVFEKGYRTAAAKQSVRDGSGLGLHIAKLIADAHQTKVWYKARNVGADGMGTNVFSVKIPG